VTSSKHGDTGRAPSHRPAAIIVAESGDAGGIGRYCLDLADALAPDVALACLCVTDCTTGGGCWLRDQADARHLRVARVPMPRRGWRSGYRGLGSLWRSAGRPVIHVNGRRGNAVALALRLSRRGFRYVTTVHGVLGLHSRRNLVYRIVDLAAGRTARAVVAVDDHGRRQLLAAGSPAARTITIRNGLSAGDLRDLAEVASARHGQRDAHRTLTVGFLGRLSPEKGTSELVDIGRALARRDPPASVVIAGDGPERERLEAASADVSSGLSLVGTVTDAAAFLAQVDVLVMPSHNEGLPYVLLEAMAAGCAVVAFRVGGIPEVVERGDLGVLVEAGDRRAFISAVLALLDDPNQVASLGAAATRHVQEAFSLDGRLPRIREVYGLQP
jgi:glycosyltransferase involved in cell wall biosynthesis